MRARRDDSLLLVVDVQSKLAPHVAGQQALIARAAALVAAARVLAVPVIATEHCPDAIGPLVEPIRDALRDAPVFVKHCFAATDHNAFVDLVRATGRSQVVIAGMEAHVCVMQTALGLRRCGFEVYVAADAVGSRSSRQCDRSLALERLRGAGCTVATTETLIFEWTGSGNDRDFRTLLAIVKTLSAGE